MRRGFWPTVGERYLCQYYNSVEHVFYGEKWEAEVISIDHTHLEGRLFGSVLI